MRKRSIFDKILGYFAPKSALSREKSRLALEMLGERRFEAAAKSRRTAHWNSPGTDANSANSGAIQTLRNRSRDMVRNDGYAARAVSAIVEHTVGTGIVMKPTGKAKGKVKAAADAWKIWADSTACDYDGRHDFYGLQALAFRSVVESGEVLIRRVRTTDAIPLKLQVIECDYLDHLKNERLDSGGYILQGVEHDRTGARVAYWLFEQHPGDATVGSAGASATSKRFNAVDILHVYRQDRPGQIRGTPWIASVAVTLKDLSDFEDAQLMRQKVASSWALFIHDTEAPLDPTGSTAPIIDKVEPGLIEILPPGKDIKFASPPGVDGYSEHVNQLLRRVAAGMGISAAALTGDLSQVNFSSGRMGWLEMQRNIEAWRWRILVPVLCDRVWGWFTEAAFLGGYQLQGVLPVWTPPRREMIDPNSELTAQVNAIRAGVTTLSEVIRSNGYDPAEVLSERAEDDALLDKLSITLDSDPRRIMKSGGLQPNVGGS